MDLNSEYGLKEEYGRYSLVLESQLHIKHIIEELDELQLEARSLPDWTRNLDTIETTCLYSHPSNELFNSTILESLAQLLEKKYLSVKHVDLYEYRELHCDLYPNPRLWSIPGSDRLKPGPQELRLFDCMLDPTYCSLWPWIYMLPTLRAVRILGENTRFLNDSKWSLCPYADATRAWITTIELRINRVDMIQQAVTFTHYFANLQHLELDFSCTVGAEEENALTGKCPIATPDLIYIKLLTRKHTSFPALIPTSAQISSSEALTMLLLLSSPSILSTSSEMEMGASAYQQVCHKRGEPSSDTQKDLLRRVIQSTI